MVCEKCGCSLAEGGRFCPNCGAATRQSGFQKASFDTPDKTITAQKSNNIALTEPSRVSSSDYRNTYPENDPERIRDIIREENEKSTRANDSRRWANVSLIMGILSICFITAGVGVIAIVLAFVFGGLSNKAADAIHIPREKKAKTGMILACVPFMVAVLAGIVVGILALCGVFG